MGGITEYERGYLEGLRFARSACKAKGETIAVPLALMDESERILTSIEARMMGDAGSAQH